MGSIFPLTGQQKAGLGKALQNNLRRLLEDVRASEFTLWDSDGSKRRPILWDAMKCSCIFLADEQMFVEVEPDSPSDSDDVYSRLTGSSHTSSVSGSRGHLDKDAL